MRLSRWTRRAALAGCGAVLGAAVIVPAAEAQQPAPPAPITLSPEESAYVCGDLLPKLKKRAEKAQHRINGGADVKGSPAWLRDRAQKQRAKGHEKIAEKLEKRADRLAGRAGEVTSALQRAEAFQSAHCGGAK